jgi:hypothetical protein
MLFRPPELFTVETNTAIDERTDIWVITVFITYECVLYVRGILL